MIIPPGTFFYGISNDEDSLMYAGDRIICVALHSNEGQDRRTTFAILQSIFTQCHIAENRINLGPGQGYTEDYAELIRDYLSHPTASKSEHLHKTNHNYVLQDYRAPQHSEIFQPSASSFHAIQVHQKQIVPDLDHYLNSYLPSEYNFTHELVQENSQLPSFLEFQKSFLPYSTLKSFISNPKPLL